VETLLIVGTYWFIGLLAMTMLFLAESCPLYLEDILPAMLVALLWPMILIYGIYDIIMWILRKLFGKWWEKNHRKVLWKGRY
jgi:hypothetical protein